MWQYATMIPVTSPTDLITTTQAGEILGVGRESVRRYADAGKLPFQLTPGGHRRFRRSDVTALATASTPAGSAS